MRFEGIYTPVITPYDADMRLDRDGFVAVVEHLVEAGVAGIIVAGTTGEFYAQTREERVELMRLARKATQGRVPLIVGTGAFRTEESIDYAEQAAHAGADAILVSTPPYSTPSERENALHALAVDRAANLPVMLYNYPGRTGANMGEAFLDEVGQSTNVQAIKESSGDINRVHLLARDYPHIQLACGTDDQALEFFAWGARSWVCAGANFAPEAHIALYRACVLDGDFDRGRRIMSAMLPLMRALEQGGKFVACIKDGMAMRGLPAGAPRRPLMPLDDEERREFRQVVEAMDREVQAIEAEQPGR